MPTPLSSYPRPRHDTGLGFHDSSDVGANPPNIEAHARALRQAGISWYKILEAGGNKVHRCRIYLAHDIQPIVRLYKHRPHPDYVVYPGEVARYVAVGVRYFEVGNEPNISPDEWREGAWPAAADMGRIIAEQWISASAMVRREGGIPLVYAMTPEGTYAHAGGHRRIARDFLNHLRSRSALGTLEGAGVAIHPRPHNNPPNEPNTATNTVAFNEWRWFATIYREFLGWDIPLFATEHGYSIGDAQNTNFPRIDEHLWSEHNRELFERMNPSHPQAIPANLFCLCYWLETAGGVWRNDQVGDGWFPEGLRAWGRRFASMQVNWNRSIPVPAPQPTPQPQPEVAMSDDARLIQILKRRLGNRFQDIRASMPDGPGSYAYVDSRLMKHIALHHSASSVDTTPQVIGKFHTALPPLGRGWPGPGYHFVIAKGTVYYVGSVDTQRAHIANRNDEALGICFTGTYDTAPLATRDIEAGRDLILGLDEFYGHKKEIHGHNWFMQPGYTTCPGRVVEIIPELRKALTPVPAPTPKPNRPPLPEDEPLTDQKTFLQKLAWWTEEHERLYTGKQYLRASEVRKSLMKWTGWARDKWAA